MKNTPLGPDALRLVSHCPLCNSKEHPIRARVLSEDGKTRLVHVTCRRCGCARLALILEGESGSSTVGVVTDLSHEDVLRVHGDRRISTDDVIDAHAILGAGIAERLSVPLKKRRNRAKSQVKSRRAARS